MLLCAHIAHNCMKKKEIDKGVSACLKKKTSIQILLDEHFQQ